MGNADFQAYADYADSRWDKDQPVLMIPRSDNADPANPTNFFLLLDMTRIHGRQNRDDAFDALAYQDATAPNPILDTLYQQITGKELEGATPDDILAAGQTAPSIATDRNFAFPELSVSVVDSRRSGMQDWLGMIYGDGVECQNISPEHEKYLQQFIRHHEAAHNILDLKEQGADYMAAITLLKQDNSPETREALQVMADFRMITGASSTGYGTECAHAIELALRLSPEELENTTVESAHKTAKAFDRVADIKTNLQNFAQAGSAQDRHDLSFGFDDFKDFIGQTWHEVKNGRVPDFGRIYENTQADENRHGLQNRSGILLSQVAERDERSAVEANSRLSRFVVPAPS